MILQKRQMERSLCYDVYIFVSLFQLNKKVSNYIQFNKYLLMIYAIYEN